MYQIIKRDGKIADFDISKIANAMKKAFEFKREDKAGLKKESEAIKRLKLTGKTIPNVQISYNVVPTQLQNKIKIWAKSQGFDTKNMIFGAATIYNDSDTSFLETDYVKNYQNEVNSITEKYYELHPGEPDAIATCLQYALTKLQMDLSQDNLKELPPSLRRNDGKLQVIKYAFRNATMGDTPIFREEMGILALIRLYCLLVKNITLLHLNVDFSHLSCLTAVLETAIMTIL